MKQQVALIVLFCLFTTLSSQTVDCIKYINSSYANPSSCYSSSTSQRPINATAVVRGLKNTTWKGAYDWTPFIVRGSYLVRDLYTEQPNCYPAEPPSGSWITGKYYEFSVKCTILLFTLQKGDLVYFDLFQSSSHKAAQCSFFIPIPGYSTEEDAKLAKEQLGDLKLAIEKKPKQPKQNLLVQ